MDDRLLQIFREESEERLERMAGALLQAEAGGGDGEVVASLFRDAHSIKGSAGMVGLAEVGLLAGEMEDVLASARTAGRLGAHVVPLLLAATDAIRAAIDGDPSGLEAASRDLRALGADPPAPEAAAHPQSAAPSNGDAPPAEAAPRPAARPGDQRVLRVRADRVDRLLATVGETALHHRRTEHLWQATADETVREELDRGEVLVSDLQDAVLDLRTLPLETIVGGLPRAVRDIAADVGREVRLELDGMDTPMDRSILDGIADVLVHLLRNAISHGIESPEDREAAGKPRTGTIRLHAEQRSGVIAVSCADDGRGVSPALMEQAQERGSLAAVLAEAGFSTAGAVSDLSGRGVGLDAVLRHVESLGGALEVDSEPGAGTTVTLLLPLTLAILRILLVERGERRFGLPLTAVATAVRDVPRHELHGRRSIELDGVTLPLADLADVLGADAPEPAEGGPVLVVTGGARRAAIACDRLLGDREVVVKSLGPLLAGVPGYLGGTILDDGAIALLLDPAHLVRAAEGARVVARAAPSNGERPAPRVLVVDDQVTVRELERTILEAAGYRVLTAPDGRAALSLLDREPDVDLVVSDIEMPAMDGLELLEAIRARPDRATLPVVIVTSRNDEAARSRGADAGADAWVVKSQFDQQTLLDTVERLVGVR